MKNALLLLLLMLSGCMTGARVAEDMAAIPPGKGVVLFSTGADETNLSFSTGLNLVQAESRKRYEKVVINIDYPFTSNFPPGHGHVRSLTLPEGDYFLIPKSGNPYFCLIKYPTFRFSVSKGTISYMGSFQLLSRKLVLTEANRQRDIRYFLGKNPSLKAEDISSQEIVIGKELFDTCKQSTFIKGSISEGP